MDLKNKTIIITGGAGGIGFETVKMLIEQGSFVAVVDNDTKNLDKVRNFALKNDIDKIEFYDVDVSRFEEVERAVNNLFAKRGMIDVLINNAAVLADDLLIKIFSGKLTKLPIENWRKTIETNLSSYFYFTREVVEKMVLKRNKGVIVNVSSISSSGNMGQTSYSASKAAVNALTVSWAQELGMFGIRVAGISPGMTDTQMPKDAMTEITLDSWIKKTPLNRMIDPKEISHGIMFILENDMFNGRMLRIDGGLRM